MPIIPLPVAIPLVAAALIAGSGKRLSRLWQDAVAMLAAIGVAALCALALARTIHAPVVYWFGGWRPRGDIAPGIAYVVDPFGAGLALLAAMLVVAILIYSWSFFDNVHGLFQTLILVFLSAMVGYCYTGDLFNLFVYFELMGVAAYVLTATRIEEKSALEGGLNFGITNSVGAFLVLWGIGLLYARTGALNLAQIGRTLSSAPADGLVIAAFVLIVTGLGVKAAFAPFHFWLVDAHAVAPTPICVLFSGVMVELGLYGIVRIYWTVFADCFGAHAGAVRALLLGLGALTAALGAALCFMQRHLKRLLAFSTISHMGMLLMGVALLDPDALAGVGIYVLAHGGIKGALFMCAGVLLNHFSSVDELMLHGKARNLRLLGIVYAVAALGLAGLPPFGTYLGKSGIEEAAQRRGMEWLPWLLLLCSALTAGGALRAGARIFLGWGDRGGEEARAPTEPGQPEEGQRNGPPRAALIGPAIVLAALALVAGLVPGLEWQARVAAHHITDRAAYASLALNAQALPPVRLAPAGSRLPGILYGCGGALAALVLMASGLYGDRLPDGVRTVGQRTLCPIMERLQAVHSGNVCDYIVWLTVGVALFGGLCALFLR